MDEDKPPTEDLETTRDSEPETGSARRIGNYRILQKVGEGGMGEVYEAEQEKPVRRRVALKIIKHGMDTKRVVARFEAERQALALMDHPCVAKVFDAGSTPRGRLYFAMEYVKGVPITEFCDRHKLTNRERLELFIQVCEGVQHAHQKAVIHRDLKPSNVLVMVQDQKRVPKIIDFGVAKATAHKLTEKTLFTELGVLIGTPEYMSPEQAEMTGENVDTRTDVYSLGVMLYELLVGALPFDSKELRSAGYEGIRQKIREEEPSPPSKRVSTLGDQSTESAKRRRVDRSTHQRQLQGDLDWITMKALEKDRTRRYGSPSELAADIVRHLKHEPVLAGPPSTAYRARKFVRRHRIGVTLAAAAALLLVGFGARERVQATKIGNERDRANKEAETAQQALEFMTGMFEVSDPSEARGNSITAREILDRGAEKIDRELEEQPLVQARLMDTMGRVYQSLGLWDEAGLLLETALRTREAELSESHPEVAESLSNLGWLRFLQLRFDDARSLQERALAIREAALGPGHVDTGWSLYRLGTTHNDYYERARLIFERELGPDHQAVSWCVNDLGMVAMGEGDFVRARRFFERALEIKENALSPDHHDVGIGLGNLGEVLMQLGEYSEAKPLLERAIAINQKALGPDHPHVGIYLGVLGELLTRMGDLTGARPLLERALTIQEKAFEPDHPYLAVRLNLLGRLLYDTREYDASESVFQRALAIQEKVLPTDHLDLAETLEGYAALLRKTDREAEAERLEARAKVIRAKHDNTTSTE